MVCSATARPDAARMISPLTPCGRDSGRWCRCERLRHHGRRRHDELQHIVGMRDHRHLVCRDFKRWWRPCGTRTAARHPVGSPGHHRRSGTMTAATSRREPHDFPTQQRPSRSRPATPRSCGSTSTSTSRSTATTSNLKTKGSFTTTPEQWVTPTRLCAARDPGSPRSRPDSRRATGRSTGGCRSG